MVLTITEWQTKKKSKAKSQMERKQVHGMLLNFKIYITQPPSSTTLFLFANLLGNSKQKLKFIVRL